MSSCSSTVPIMVQGLGSSTVMLAENLPDDAAEWTKVADHLWSATGALAAEYRSVMRRGKALDAAVVAHGEFEGFEAGSHCGIHGHRVGDVELLHFSTTFGCGIDLVFACLQGVNQVGDDVG